jgi:homoserine O-acetyltransferase
MDSIIAIATSYESAGRSMGNAFVANNAIRKDPRYKDGYYTEQPVDGLAQAAMGQFLWYLSAPFYREKFPTKQAFLNVLQGEGKKAANGDANDIIWRNDNLMAHSMKDRVGAIKAKALIIGINQDELFPPDTDIIPLAGAIKGARHFAYDSLFGHVGCALDLKKAEGAIRDFLQD